MDQQHRHHLHSKNVCPNNKPSVSPNMKPNPRVDTNRRLNRDVKPFLGKCWKCGNKGHRKGECRVKTDAANNVEAPTETPVSLATTQSVMEDSLQGQVCGQRVLSDLWIGL